MEQLLEIHTSKYSDVTISKRVSLISGFGYMLSMVNIEYSIKYNFLFGYL